MLFSEQIRAPNAHAQERVGAGWHLRRALWGRWRQGAVSVALRWIASTVFSRIKEKFVRGPLGWERLALTHRRRHDDISRYTRAALGPACPSGFSSTETAMTAVNRYRLRHRAHRARGAKLVALLGKPTLPSVILREHVNAPRDARR
jgi:hypothetical protein